MLRNQRGTILFWVLSALLFIAIALVLLVPTRFNLDPQKNTDDCTTNMKNIWVAASDYLIDQQKDFDGNLETLRNTRKKDNSKNFYLTDIKFCPESQGAKTNYIVYAKYMQDMVGTELKNNSGIIVFCPNLERFPKHFLDKNFYDNMSTTKLQNFMIDDMNYIDQQTKSNGKAKTEAVMKYIQLWKTDPDVYAKRSADLRYLKRALFPDNPDLMIAEEAAE